MNYEAELQTHIEPLLQACSIRDSERVLDIGCGTGQTTREAARLAANGSVLGVDITGSMITQARELAAAEGLSNIRFEHGDAQAYDFASQQFDIALSRYGTMFFNDPIAAFRNIRGALQPGGRLVMMVWQAHALNDWSVAIHDALASSTIASETFEHFSFADPNRVEHILSSAGFTNAAFNDVRARVYYGESAAAALEWVRGFRFIRTILQALDAESASRTIARLRETLARHAGERGVWFDAREWIVTAECR